MIGRSCVRTHVIWRVILGTALLAGLTAGTAAAQSAARVGTFVKTTGAGPVTQTVPHNLGQTPAALILWTEGRTDEAFSNAAGVAFREATSVGAASGVLSLTVARPGTAVANDMLIAAISVSANAPTITAPAGWTLVRQTNNTNNTANALAIYRRIATATDPANFTWTFTASTGSAGVMAAFSGVDLQNPIDVENAQTNSSNTAQQAPSLTTTDANEMIVSVHAIASAVTWTAPAGMTEAAEARSGALGAAGESVSVNYVLQAAAGASGTKTATASGNADRGVGQTLALRPANPNYFGIGMTDGVNSGSVSTSMETGAAPPTGARRVARKALTIAKWDTTVLAEADLQGWNATSFTLNWTTNDTGGYIIHYIAIGGAGVQARVLNWQMATAVGAQSVTGFGFQPTSVIHIHGNSGLTGAPPSTTAAGGFGMGAVDAAGNQWAASTFSSLANPTDTQRGQLTNATIFAVNNALSVAKNASFTGWNADGFNLNYTTASALAGQVFTLALRGINVKAGNFNKVTGTAPATQAITGLGFQPQAMFFHSFQDIARATPVAHARFALGASDGSVTGSGTPIAASSAYTDSDAVSPSYVQGVSKISRAFIKVNNATSTIDAEAVVSSIEANGFTLSWTTNDAVATQLLYLAFAPLTPTEVRLLSLTATRYDRGTLLQWRTGYESHNLGFTIYREVNGVRTKVNATPVAGSGLLAGAGTVTDAERSYAYWDLDAPASTNAVYWLADLDFNGTATLHGPVTPTAGGHNAPPLAASADLREFSRRIRDKHVSITHASTTHAAVDRPTDDGGTVRSTRRDAAGRGPLPGVLTTPEIVQQRLAADASIKIGVRATGWYRVTQPQLAAAGLPADVDPHRLQLFADGREQAIRVTGDADSRFDSSDAIEFFGVGLDEPATDTHVYWLTIGQANGKRISTRPGPPAGGATPPTLIRSTVSRTDRSIYFAALLNGPAENWFGPLVSLDPLTLTLPSEHRDATAGDAELAITLQGVTSDPQVGPDHRVGVLVNGVDVGEMPFDGQANATHLFQVPAAALIDGTNDITLTARGGAADLSLVDTVRLTYWHTNTADADQLWLTVEGHGPQDAVIIHGFTSPEVRVMDVSVASTPVELRRTVSSEGNGLYAVAVANPFSGSRQLFAFADLTMTSPAFVRANTPSNWRAASPGFDHLVITDATFSAAAQTLASHRNAQGYHSTVVDIEDVYDEFSFGHKRPEALRAFFSHARQAWPMPPRFAVLLGDATIDPRDHAGLGAADFVPTMQVGMTTVTMETASDDALADLDDDGTPELAVGRLSARTPAQADGIVAKIVAYDATGGQPWTRNVLLVADQNDETASFEAYTDRLAAQVPAAFTTTRINRGALGPDLTQSQLLNQVNAGQLVVNFTGHGSVQLWGREGDVLAAPAVDSSWQNIGRLPLIVAMNCLNGLFTQIWDEESLAETLQRTSQGGAVAVWASSAVTSAETQAIVNEELFRLLFSGVYATVGEAVVAAKRIVDGPDLRRSWIFFGDPAMRLASGPGGLSAPGATTPATGNGPGVSGAASLTGGTMPAGPTDPPGVVSTATLPAVAPPALGGQTLRLPDLNGDGRADVLAWHADTGRWTAALSNGETVATQDGEWPVGWQPLAADLNGDGRSDVVLVSEDGTEWMQALAGANGRVATTHGRLGEATTDAHLLSGDVTGDGQDDLVVYDASSGLFTVGISDGHGEFTLARSALPAGLQLQLVAAARNASDRRARVIGYDRTAGEGLVAVLLRNGRLALLLSADWGRGWQMLPLRTAAAQSGPARRDADGLGTPDGPDKIGRLDVLDRLAVFYDEQSGAWQLRDLEDATAPPLDTGTWPAHLALMTADLSGDGVSAVVGYDAASGQWLQAVPTSATSATSAKPATSAPPETSLSGTWAAGWTLAVGDLDGDGRDDLLLLDPVTGIVVEAVTVGPGVSALTTRTVGPGATLVGMPR